MTKQEAKVRLEKLKKLINKYRYERLVLDKPIVEESVEDSLKKELFDLEQEWPDLVTADSPTQRIGGKPLDKFTKFTHPERMLSFNDSFDEEDMQVWQKRLERLDPSATKNGFYGELKIDGLAIELVYEKGLLKIGATRGDGLIGEEVTQNLKTVEAIPLSLDDTKRPVPDILVVRGEVFISHREFKRINQEQEKNGGAVYANPRNLAAGSIRQLDPVITASRRMDSYAYSVITDVGQTTHEEEHDILKDWGFKTNPHNKYLKDLKEVQNFRDHWEKEREKLDYEIDGVVIITNENRMFKKLGVVGKAPRAAVAYKFSPRESTTKVEDIMVSVGRTGTLTPIAMLEPVNIGGTTVSRATLHNEDEIRRLDVRIGDTVVVGRAGDVIPDIKKSLTELRTGKEKVFHFPRTCPVCGEAVKRVEGEAAYKCTNQQCPAIKREAIYHFVSKSALDVDGVGPKIIDQLMDAGLLKDTADLYTLKKEDLLNLERFAEKSAENTIAAIQSKKKVSLDRFIYALGIPHVGSETAVDLARKFGSLEKISSASLEELLAIKDIGQVVAKSIFEWFQDKHHQKLLAKFKEVGLQVLKQESTQKSSNLKGLTFVFTGTMENLSRERAEELVREHGGDTSSSVSRATSYVVAGSEAGSKLDKAQKLGVKVLDEKGFLDMVS
ncbi:MAG: NAD-dependent DNA ligase LigA [bacterium]|nr:NAD-dependent DNA ligase LigA [bacterium]